MVKLTKRLVESTSTPKNDMFLWDSELAGFGVRIFQSGKRSYLVQYRIGKRTRRYTIGFHGLWTVEMARKEAKALLGKVAQGEDPILERVRASLTVGQLCDRYLAEGMVTAKDSSIRQARSNIDNHIKPLIGITLAAKLSRGDIQQMMRDIASGKTAKTTSLSPRRVSRIRGGKGTANRVVTTLCAALTFGVDNNVRIDNPALKIKRFPGKKLDRFLSPTELARLGSVLAAAESLGIENAYAIAALRLLVLTGCRKNEILSLKRNWVDIHNRCLRLPDSKTGAKVVHLGQPAIRVITDLKPLGDNPYLIPGRGRFMHLMNLASVWRRIRTSAALEDVRLHDLRHSFASMGASNGDSLLVIGALLGHRSTKTTQRYTHLADHPVRSAADRIAATIAGFLNPQFDNAQGPHTITPSPRPKRMPQSACGQKLTRFLVMLFEPNGSIPAALRLLSARQSARSRPIVGWGSARPF
jgi:integrase